MERATFGACTCGLGSACRTVEWINDKGCDSAQFTFVDRPCMAGDWQTMIDVGLGSFQKRGSRVSRSRRSECGSRGVYLHKRDEGRIEWLLNCEICERIE